MNRKLIRTTLAEVKGRGDTPHQKASEAPPAPTGRPSSSHAPRGGGGSSSSSQSSSPPPSSPQGRKRVPPTETNAEIFYYKKQMDSHTVMVIVLQDGEEIEGTIEWYDKSALKVNRRDAPNILLLKHNIKYMYKAEDRAGGGE